MSFQADQNMEKKNMEYVNLSRKILLSTVLSRNVGKEKNVLLQAHQTMEYVNLNRILPESTAVALKIVDGMHWKHAMIRVNVSNVTTKRLMNKRVLQEKSEN